MGTFCAHSDSIRDAVGAVEPSNKALLLDTFFDGSTKIKY